MNPMKTILFLTVLMMSISPVLGAGETSTSSGGWSAPWFTGDLANSTIFGVLIGNYINTTSAYSCDYSYCIQWNGSTIVAINGTNDSVEFSGADAATVHNQAYATAGSLPIRTFKSIGNFSISTELLFKNYSIIDATEAKFILANGVGAATTDAIVDILQGYHHIDIVGGTWEGNSVGQSSWIALIRMMGHDLTISKAVVNDSTGDCIFNRDINNRVFDNTISNCQDTGVVMGGLKTATNASFGKAYNNIITDSNVGLDISNDADNVEFYGNKLNNITQTGIKVTFTANGVRMPWNSNIHDNILEYAGGDISGMCGINIAFTGAEGTIIENNHLNNSKRSGICTVSSTTIRNNFIKNSFWHGITITNNSIVTGNEIQGSSQTSAGVYSGVYITGVNNTLTNNKIFDNQTTKTQLRAITENTGSDLNQIYDNDVNAGTHATYILKVGTNTILRNNYRMAGYDHGISTTCTSKTAFGAGDACKNSTTGFEYAYNGTAWVYLMQTQITERFTGNGVTTEYKVNSAYTILANSTLVFVDGLMKINGLHYNETVGTNVTFTTAPGNALPVLIQYINGN